MLPWVSVMKGPHYGDVAAPLLTSKVTIVAKALHTSVAWHKHLVRPIDSTVYLCTNLIICLFVDE